MHKHILKIVMIGLLLLIALGGACFVYKQGGEKPIAPQKIVSGVNTFVVAKNGNARFFSKNDKNFWGINPKTGDKKIIFETATDEFCPNMTEEIKFSLDGNYAAVITLGFPIDAKCLDKNQEQIQIQPSTVPYLGIIDFEKNTRKGLLQTKLLPVWSKDAKSIVTVVPKDNKVRELRQLDLENLENEWQTLYTYEENDPTLWPEDWRKDLGLILLTRRGGLVPQKEQKKALFLLDTKTNNLRQLTWDEFISDPQLSPKGNYLFYISQMDEKFYQLRLWETVGSKIPKTFWWDENPKCVWENEKEIFCIIKKLTEAKKDKRGGGEIIKLNVETRERQNWTFNLASYETILEIVIPENDTLYILTNIGTLYRIKLL